MVDNLIETVGNHLLSWDCEVEQKVSVVQRVVRYPLLMNCLSTEVIRTFSEVSAI